MSDQTIRKERQWTYIVFFLTGIAYFLFGFFSGSFFSKLFPIDTILDLWSIPLLVCSVLIAAGLYVFRKWFLIFVQKAFSFIVSILIFLIGFITAMFFTDVYIDGFGYYLEGFGFAPLLLLLFILAFSAIVFRAFKKQPGMVMKNIEIKNSIKSENMSDLKIFLLCISSGAIGFSLISILSYEIPLFLRVSIAFLFLGIPLMDIKKIILFGIAGGLGFFIKDLVFWDIFSFKWISLYSTTIENSLLTGIIIGTFLSIVLWNRKAIEIFPLTTAIAFSSGPILSYLVFFPFNMSFNPIQPNLGVGFLFGSGICFYLLSINKTHSPLRSILKTFAILFISANVLFMIIFSVFSFGHPSYVGSTMASIGEVVEKEGTSIAVTNYTFMRSDNGKILKADIIARSNSKVEELRLHLWFRHDEFLGRDITLVTVGARPALNEEEIPGRPNGHLEAIGANSTDYHLYFENLPERVRTKDFAVVWEIWTRKGIEYVIWQTNGDIPRVGDSW